MMVLRGDGFCGWPNFYASVTGATMSTKPIAKFEPARFLHDPRSICKLPMDRDCQRIHRSVVLRRAGQGRQE